MRRVTILLAVVLAVALSGCSLSDDAQTEGTADPVTPAPIPAVTDSDVSVFDIEEITNGSTVSPTMLARTHRDAVANRSVRIHEQRNWTTRGVEVRDRSVLIDKNATLTAADEYRHNASRQVNVFRSGEQRNETVSVFRNETDRFRRLASDRNVTYSQFDVPRQSTAKLFNMSGLVRQSLSVESASVERTRWRGDSYYLIEGEQAAGRTYSLTESFQVRAIVQENGLVRQLSVNYTESTMGRDRFVTYTVTIDPIERERLAGPEWLPEARNRTG